MGPVGINQLRSFQFFAEKFSGAGNPAGVRFEIEDFDNKLSASETLTAMQAAIRPRHPLHLARQQLGHRRGHHRGREPPRQEELTPAPSPDGQGLERFTPPNTR